MSTLTEKYVKVMTDRFPDVRKTVDKRYKNKDMSILTAKECKSNNRPFC
jgi:hypothetical protein